MFVRMIFLIFFAVASAVLACISGYRVLKVLHGQSGRNEKSKVYENGWISVDEQLPDYSGYYIARLSDEMLGGSSMDEMILYYKKEQNIWNYKDDYENKVYSVSSYVTAWQPLPEQHRG